MSHRISLTRAWSTPIAMNEHCVEAYRNFSAPPGLSFRPSVRLCWRGIDNLNAIFLNGSALDATTIDGLAVRDISDMMQTRNRLLVQIETDHPHSWHFPSSFEAWLEISDV